MKEKNTLHLMNMIDDDLIEAARPKGKKTRKIPWLRYISIAACFLLIVVAIPIAIYNGFDNHTDDPIFKPPSNSAENGDYSRYYALLKTYWDKHPLYGNGTNDGGAIPPSAGGSLEGDTNEAAPGYVEVTDNQVAGVIEGDLFKRTDKYIFYLAHNQLTYFSLDSDSQTIHHCYTLVESDKAIKIHQRELYLSADGKTATVIFSYYGYVKVVSLDVSDPANAQKLGEFTISGSLINTRLSGDKLLLKTRFEGTRDAKEDELYKYIPYYDMGNGAEYVPAGCIIAPDEISSQTYNTVTMLDINDFAHLGTLSYLDNFLNLGWYVSENSIYMWNPISITTDKVTDGSSVKWMRYTGAEIVRIEYKNGILLEKGRVTISGRILNQYSLDEKDGILRVFATVNETHYKQILKNDGSVYNTQTEWIQSASLYCVDVDTMKTVSSVERFAPNGETVQSVRFEGDDAYVCTAIIATMCDPVFYFDLRDINNITYKDTGTIDGYSAFLKPLGGGYLLGFGTSDGMEAKIEIYKETENGVEIAGTHIIERSFLGTNYKSKYVDTKNQLIGFSAVTWDNRQLLHYLLKYEIADDGSVTMDEIHVQEIPSRNSVEEVRSTVVDDYIYILATGLYRKYKIS